MFRIFAVLIQDQIYVDNYQSIMYYEYSDRVVTIYFGRWITTWSSKKKKQESICQINSFLNLISKNRTG